MRKAKLPIAVFIVLIAVALVFAGCVHTTSVTVNFVYPDGSTASKVYQSDEGSPSISEAPDAKYIAGQHFTGWYLDQAFTQSVTFPHSLADTETLTLYANYVPGYAVTLSGGYGQAYATVPQTDPTLTEAPDPGTSPSGQTFMGWYLDSGLTQAVTYPYTVTPAGATFYASWQTVDSNSAVIMLSGGYGAASATFALNSQINESDLNPGASPTGATFAGWYLDAACTQPVTFPYTVTGNVTFHAKWEDAGYLVTFDTMGGDPMEARRVTVIPGSGSNPSQEFVPTREGYVFRGWFLSRNSTENGRPITYPYQLDRDRTLYAGWTEELDPNATQQKVTTQAPYTAFKAIFERYAEIVGTESDRMSIALEADVDGGLITLHADVQQEGGTGDIKPNDLMFKVEKFDDNTTFGLYITENRLFIDIGGENGLYEVTDVQSDYIAAIIAKVPGLLEGLLEGVDLDSALSLFGGLDGLIGIVFGIFFDNAQITTTVRNGDQAVLVTDYQIEFKLNSFTSGISDILGLINLGALLGFDLNLVPLFDWIEEVIPQYKVVFETEFGEDSIRKHPGLNVTYNDPENEETYGQPAWNFGIASITLGDEVDDVEGFLDFPDNVDAALTGEGTATEFSFTNLQFDIDLTLGTGSDADGALKKLDVGKLIKMFTDTVEIPEGLIVLESDFGYKLRAQVDLDLDYDMIASGNFVDNNLILLELYPLDQFGNMDEDNKAMGIYYKEGKLYISLSSLIPNYWKADNIVIDLGGVPELVARVVTTIRDAIDGALFADDGTEGGTEGGTENVSVQGVSATSANLLALADGGYQLSPTLGSFIDTLCEVLAIPDGVLEVDGDRIVLNVQKIANQQQVGEDGTPVVDDEGKPVYVDNDIFDFIDRFMGIAGQDPISDLIPDGISGKLEFVFFEGGLKSIDISGSISPDSDQSINVGLSINNFLIGVKDGELEERIDAGIGDKEGYTNNLGELLGSALEGIDLNMNLSLSYAAGQYNIGDFIAGLGLAELIGIPLDWTFDSEFKMDLGMHVIISLDKENPTNSKLVVEIEANEPIYIGEKDENNVPVVAQPAGLLVGIYGYYNEDGEGYVSIDLSNINIANIQFPRLSAKLDFAKLVFDLLDQLSIEIDGEETALGDISLGFNLVDLLGGGDSSGSGLATSALSTADVVENPGATLAETELTDVGSILVGLNSEALYASFSLAAIQALLTEFNVSLGDIDLSSFKIDVDNLNLSRLDGITLEASGTLMENKAPGAASTDQNLNLKIALGTQDYPIAIGKTQELEDKFDLIFNGDGSDRYPGVFNELDSYSEEVIELVLNTIAVSRIELEMDLHTLDSRMNFTDIINNILASQGQQFNLPIDLYLDEWNPIVTLVVEWKLDIENGNIGHDSVVNISLVYEKKELFGVALNEGDAIVKLDGLGLFNINLANSPLIETLITMIQGLIDEVQGMELGDIINKLLTTVDGSEQTIDVAAPASDTSGTEGGDTSGETGGEEGETTPEEPTNPLEPWLQALLRSISANNTTLFVELTTDIVDEVVRGLAGFSLGIDIGAGIEFDIVDGALSLDLKINDNITLDATLTLAIGQQNVNDLMVSKGELQEGSDYQIDVGTDAAMIDGTTGTSIAQGLFDNLNLNLSLDILNNNADTNNADQYLRLSVQRVNTDTPLANTGGRVAPRGTFLIQVGTVNEAGYNNTQAGGMDTIVYAILDYNNSTITIYVKQGWIVVFSGLLDVGEIVNNQNLSISLASDTDGDGQVEGIIEQIGALLDGLISDLENMGSSTPSEEPGTDAPTTETPSTDQPAASESALDMTPLTDLFADLDIMQLLGGGIDLKFNATGTFNADISFDAYTLNTLIDDLMDLILGPNSIIDLGQLAPEMFTQHHLKNIRWDRDGGLWDNLAQVVKDDIIPDIVSSPTVTAAVGMNLSGLLGLFGGTIDNVLNTVKPLITTLLPFPVMDTVNAGINFVDGTLANIYITGYDNGEAIVSADEQQYTKWGRHSGNKLELWIYNQFDSVGAPGNVVGDSAASGGIVDWGEIPKTVVYEPYQYNSGNYQASFVLANFSNRTARYQRGTHVMKANVSFKFADGQYAGQDVQTVLTNNPNWLNEIAASGGTEGSPIPITVKADFSGTVREITIYLAVNPTDSEIVSIDPITRYAYDSDPAYLVLNFADGTSRSVAWSAVASTKNFEPDGYRAHEKKATVTFFNDKTAEVSINYLDSIAEKLINADDLSMSVDLYSMTSTSTSITEFTPEVLYFNYPDGAAVAMKVDAWENTDELNAALIARATEPDNMSAIYGTITAVIGQGTSAEQRIDIKVNIRTKSVTSVKYGDFRNAIQINPYDIYLDILAGGDGSNNVVPTQAEAYYNEGEDSYHETVHITVSDFELNFDSIGYDTSTQTTATIALDKTKYGGWYGWTLKDIPVNVVLNTITKVWFVDPSSPTGYSDKLVIDPYVYNSFETTEERKAFFPTTALVEFSNGYSCELPIRFPNLDVDNLLVEYATYNSQQLLQIGFAPEGWTETQAKALEDRFLQDAYVYFEFEGKEIDSINIDGYADGTYLEIDPVEVLLRGTEPLPDTVEVIYTDGTTAQIEVSEWDQLVITADSLNDKDGATGTITGQLTADGRNEFTLNYRILPRYGMSSPDITFDSYDYSFDSDGNISFDVLGSTIAVNFLDGTTTEEPVLDEEGVPTGETEPVDTVHTYYIGVVQWETGGANFGSGNNAGGIVTAVFEDVYNKDYVTLDIDLIAETLQPVKDEGGNFVVTYLGLDYILAMGTMGADGKLSSIFDNFDSSQLANRRIDNATVTMAFYTGEYDLEGNPVTVMRAIKADIELDNSVPTDVDAFNAAGRTPFDYSLGTSPEEQGATPFTATVTVYDGANTAQTSVVLPLYFGYDGSAQTGATA